MFCRHDLAWLTASGWEAALDAALPGQHAAIEQWRHQDWPTVVRRLDAGLAHGQVSVGIPLPPAADGSKGRIALNVSEENVGRITRPIALNDAAQAAPATWRPLIEALAASLPLHAYGSLAMQALTGQRYLTSTSDIDLLFLPTDINALHAGLALLERHAAGLPLDGEIMFPSCAAVAWKEWIGAGTHQARVLVKDAGAVRLAPMAELLATLEGA